MDSTAVLSNLLQGLWTKYKSRVQYAATYQKMVEARGGQVQNDHIAFRTVNAPCGQPAGVEAIARLFLPLGYVQKDKYIFTDKKLTSWHYEHPLNPNNPKLFISQLEVEQLTPSTSGLIKDAISDAPDLVSANDLKLLEKVRSGKIDKNAGRELVENLVKFFVRPWIPPMRSVLEAVNKESQYAAWTLLHGNSVNHFTAYINQQNVKEWPDLEATVEALREAGIPMKAEFEGARGSKLRQSSTQAWDEECDVIEKDGKHGRVKWSYAYYELAERGVIPGPDGKLVRFQGFLGEQATNLFEMTKR
jgi:hypothetical protein